jgi:hypothetical protein
MNIPSDLTLCLAVVACLGTSLAQNKVPDDECKRTAGMQVWSNVFVHEETGDLLGYDLAIKPEGSQVDALLYVYEGGESDAGISLSGQTSKNRLSIQGTWVEHLIEYPSKREIVQTHLVKIVGTLDAAAFRGDVIIEGMAERGQIQLKRVKRIWSCQKRNSFSRRLIDSIFPLYLQSDRECNRLFSPTCANAQVIVSRTTPLDAESVATRLKAGYRRPPALDSAHLLKSAAAAHNKSAPQKRGTSLQT